MAVGWSGAEAEAEAVWDTEPGLEGLASQNEDLGVSSWTFLLTSCESSGALQWAQVGSGMGFLLCLRARLILPSIPLPPQDSQPGGSSPPPTPPPAIALCVLEAEYLGGCGVKPQSQMSASLLNSCVIVDKSLNLTGLSLPRLQKGTDNSTYCIRWCQSVIIHMCDVLSIPGIEETLNVSGYFMNYSIAIISPVYQKHITHILFLVTALLRYNSQTMQLTHLKCTIQ